MKLICSVPTSISVLPYLKFDDYGNLIDYYCISLNLDFRIEAIAEISSFIETNFLEEFIRNFKAKFNLGDAKIEIIKDCNFESLNPNASKLLAACSSYLRLFGKNDEYLDFIDSYCSRNLLSFILPSNLLKKGFSYSSYPRSGLNFEIEFEKFEVILVELKSLDMKSFLKDEEYRKVIMFHSKNNFERFSYTQDIYSLYESNNNFAFQAGLLSPELDEIMQIALKEGSDFVGYNFFFNAMHCLVKSEKSKKIYDTLLGVLSNNEKIALINIAEESLKFLYSEE